MLYVFVNKFVCDNLININKYYKCSKLIKFDNFNWYFDRVIVEISIGCLLVGLVLGKKGIFEKYN